MSDIRDRCPVGAKVLAEGDDVPRHENGDPITWTVESYEITDGKLFANLRGLRQYMSLHMIMNGPGPMFHEITHRAELGEA